MDLADSPEEFWLFGYGSLIWKPPPHYDKRLPGYVTGYVRRFWQSRYTLLPIPPHALPLIQDPHPSEDHRGTPSSPGRVVTLISRFFWETLTDHHETTSDRVWGAAYRIPASHIATVQSYLDIREINGYSVQYTAFHSSDKTSPSIKCLVYIGLPDNPQFTGVQDPQALAEHIARSKGPSGQNDEYLFMLERALSELGQGSEDAHVQDLADRVREIERRGPDSTVSHMALERETGRVQSGRSHDQQEEVEKEGMT